MAANSVTHQATLDLSTAEAFHPIPFFFSARLQSSTLHMKE